MWFRNLMIYRLPANWAANANQIEEQLARQRLAPCPNNQSQSIGWIEPCEHGSLLHAVNRQWLLALGVEQKLLPASVVKQFTKDRAKEIEERDGRKVGRKEMRELREQITDELLPRAFVRRRTTYGWIDPIHGWLVIDAGAAAKAEEFIEQLRKSVDGIPIRPLKLQHAPSARMTAWVSENEAPAGFTVDQDLGLRSPEEATVRYAKHALEGAEIRQHIANGKSATRLGMTWNDRISLLLADTQQVKRLAFLDILKESSEDQSDNAEERFDLDFALMAGELARLLDDLVEALGGEQMPD